MASHYRKTMFRCGIIIPHVLFLLPVLELAGLHWTWGLYASGRLDQQVADLRKAGEPTTWQELIGPAVPDAENAAIELQAAFKAIDQPTFSALNEIDVSKPLTPADVAVVHKALNANAQVLKLVEAASAKQRLDWHIKQASPLIFVPFPALSELRGTAYLLRAAAVDAHANGDDERAIRHIREMLVLARGASRHPSLVGHLVYIGIVTMADNTLAQIAPDLRIGPKPAGGEEAPPEKVKALIAELLDLTAPRDSLRDALRFERLMQIDGFRAMANGINIYSNQGANAPPLAPLGGYLTRPIALSAARVVAESTTRMIGLSDVIDWPTCRAGLEDNPRTSPQHPWLGMFARILEPSFSSALNRHFRHLADRRLAATALAIRWYAVDHDNKLPAKLEDLVPAYLPAAPLDPFSVGNKSLGYLPADNPRLYSIGENMQDDGGSSAPMDSKRPANNNPWAQMDVVVSVIARK